GYDFLRHVDHSQSLLFVLFIEDTNLEAALADPKQGAQFVWDQYELLDAELSKYNKQMMKKRRLVSCNKIDLYSPELKKAIAATFKKHKTAIQFISAGTTEGVQDLVTTLFA
ncbi:hypothetical protein KA012_02520, partial [Candidatus Woesebacteria bacterium]|nr:hypothetical protein [Candidatus Woesebacteria bacterium]